MPPHQASLKLDPFEETKLSSHHFPKPSSLNRLAQFPVDCYFENFVLDVNNNLPESQLAQTTISFYFLLENNLRDQVDVPAALRQAYFPLP
jgi:hypothetical protein